MARAIIVATDHAGAPELVYHDKTGVLARQNDVDDLTEKLEYAITQPSPLARMAQQFSKRSRGRFDGLKVYPQLIEVLMNTLNH